MTTIATTSAAGNSDQLRLDYMNLLVTQLRYQNPLEPMDNTAMASQLSQLAQLEQLENISGTFKKVLAATQLSQAATLVGKTVTYFSPEDGQVREGRVDRVVVDNGEVLLVVGQDAMGFANILSVQN